MKVKVNNNNTMTVVTDTVECTSMYISNPSFEYSQNGSYNLTFALSKKDYEGSELEGAFQAIMKIAEDEAIKKAGKFFKQIIPVPMFEEEIDDNGDATGRLLFKCKQKAKITINEVLTDRPLKVVDSKGNDCFGTNFTKGTKARISFSLIPYYLTSTKSYGASKWIQAIMVIEPKIYEGGDDIFGDVEENAWVAPAKSIEQVQAVHGTKSAPKVLPEAGNTIPKIESDDFMAELDGILD